ncbi:MAG: Minf_1886 family protein [Planctomycetota bacterium]|jgi:uncharacterized repeat protein (TIGR04138 family)
MIDDPEKRMEEVILNDGRHPPEAYAFLQEGFRRAVRDVYGDEEPSPARHITGKQLCMALRELAVEKWGMLARTVLTRWNIRATIDFGNMVYLLVNNDLMGKRPEDSLEDFRDVYDFATAFESPEEFDLKE